MKKMNGDFCYTKSNNLNFVVLLFLVFVFHCKNEPKKQPENILEGNPLELKYATGFSVEEYNGYKILEIKNPWPKAENKYRYLLVKNKKTRVPEGDFNATINLPIKKIVVTSTTHIPALELLKVEQTLVGFPGIDYISSEKTRKRIDNNLVRELGKNEGINTEVLLALQPDVVIGFGVDGTNRTFETIKKSGVPVIFNGDWVEESPLAKAEWIKFFGVLFNKEKEADSIFKTIEINYLEAKKLASKAQNKPTVLSGAMHNDIWYLPNGTSTEAQLLKDANTNYLWNDSQGTGSLSLNFETVFVKAKDADIWLSPSNYETLEALKNGNSHHALFKAFKNKSIYSANNTKGASGGVLYFELGTTRPDLVLKDIIKICHPELLKNDDLYFFKRLE
ncbi:ABC transporter substrate-binding protein [Mariniflexile maritimum]|uniref:ABC transporter substrate-binding protein n=1 Tax=Mariniflexile maritimum TaxID=2682493 RepID=UPI001E3F682E|nr:ABC transporter substrate-binding protein [Mariniflexile maritimum]